MFRVITIEKSHQTTSFRRHHTLQADKQPVSNEPVATYAYVHSNLFSSELFFRMIRPAQIVSSRFLERFLKKSSNGFPKYSNYFLNASNGRRKFSNHFVNASNAWEKIFNNFLNASNAQLKFSNSYSNVSDNFYIRLNGYQANT